jgi:hypothetical protein
MYVELERMLKEPCIGYTEVLSRNLLGGAEENIENLHA